MKLKNIIILFLFISTACSNQQVILNGDHDREIHPAYKKDQAFFLNGPFQEANISSKEACESNQNIHSYEAKLTFFNGLLATLTNGIYTPRQAMVYCIDKE